MVGCVLKKGYVDTPDGQIHYGIAGTGEPLLLLHQDPRSMREYFAIVPLLAKSKKVIVMDSMGYGNSDAPPRSYSIEDYAKSVIVLLDGLKIKRTSIFGHHTGAYIACEVAAAYPERVDKLILSGLRTYIDDKMLQAMAQAHSTQLKDDGSHITQIWNTHIKMGAPPSVVNGIVLDTLNVKASGHGALATYRVEKRLPLVKCPTLFIYGTQDLGGFPEEDRLKAKQVVQRGKVEIVKEGRYIAEQIPEKLSKIVLDFLEKPGV
jgi:pimeloyl-ACP methyl ester carboxylesterase